MSCQACIESQITFEKQDQNRLLGVFHDFLEHHKESRIKIRTRDKSPVPDIDEICYILSNSHNIPEAVHMFYNRHQTLYRSSVADILDIDRSYVCKILKDQRRTPPNSTCVQDYYVKDSKHYKKPARKPPAPSISVRLVLSHPVVQLYNIARTEGGFKRTISQWVNSLAHAGKYLDPGYRISMDLRIKMQKVRIKFVNRVELDDVLIIDTNLIDPTFD